MAENGKILGVEEKKEVAKASPKGGQVPKATNQAQPVKVETPKPAVSEPAKGASV